MKLMDGPLRRIWLIVFGLFAVCAVVWGVQAKSPVVVVILLVAAVAGPALGIVNLTGHAHYAWFVAAVVGSLALTVVGFVFRGRAWGQAAAVIGICAWSLCGFLGLGAVE